MLSNNRMVNKLEAMAPELKHAYLATGRVTVGHIDQVVKNPEGRNVFKRWYVAKIRGVIVGDNGEWQHETPEAARKYGHEVLEQWQKEFTESVNTAMQELGGEYCPHCKINSVYDGCCIQCGVPAETDSIFTSSGEKIEEFPF